MKKLTLLLVITALLAIALAPARAQDETPTGTVVDVLAADADGRFSTFLAAVDASGFAPYLATAGPYTVLAPTNDAFAALIGTRDTTPEALLADVALLQRVLAYHILPGKLQAANLVELDEQTIATTLSGAGLDISVSEGVLQVNSAAPIEADVMADNGVVHVLDTVLLPPDNVGSTDTLFAVALADTPTILDYLDARASDPNTPEYTLLRAAIAFAEFEAVLGQPGSYTFLAPTDEAILRYLDRVGITPEAAFSGEGANKADIQTFLRYQIVPAAYSTADLLMLGGGFIATYDDERLLTLSIADDAPSINGLAILGTEGVAANGTVLGIDGLLFSFAETAAGPDDGRAVTTAATITDTATLGSTGEASILARLQADDQFSTFAAALTAADLATLLDSNGPYTVFAPTNAALDAYLDEQGLTLDALLADYNLLARTLLAHIVPGRIEATTISTLGDEQLATALYGELLNVGDGPTLNGIAITTPDLAASNGLIHVVDGVLAPAGGTIRNLLTPASDTLGTWLADSADDDTFTIFFAAISAAGLSEVLDGAGPYTIFVPTDDAFTAYLAQRGLTRQQFLDDSAALQRIVFYHIVPYRYVPESVPSELGQFGTLVGQTLGISLDPNSAIVLVNDAVGVGEATLLGNGVAYPINGVLIPTAE